MKIPQYGTKYLRLFLESRLGPESWQVIKPLARGLEADMGDIAEALYWICILWYDGQTDPLYASQCQNPFRPSCLASESDPIDAITAQIIYDAIQDVFLQGKPPLGYKHP